MLLSAAMSVDLEASAHPLSRLSDFDWGESDGCRASIRGVLMRVVGESSDLTNRAEAVFGSSEGRFTASLPGSAEEWQGRLDAEYELSGVIHSNSNCPARFNGVRIHVEDESGMSCLAHPPLSPFSVPRVGLVELFERANGEHPDGHAVRVIGTVTYVDPGVMFVLQSGEDSLRVTTVRKEPIEVGDTLEVVGFPWYTGQREEFQGILYRELPVRQPIKPLVVRDFKDEELYGRLVETVGRFGGFELCRDGFTTMRLNVAGQSVFVTCRGEMEEKLREALVYDPLIRVVGVAEMGADGRIELLCWTPGNLQVEEDIESRSRRAQAFFRRALFGVLSLLAVAVVVILSVFERRRRIQVSVASERKRLAEDLHDSVEQQLTGVRMFLDLAQNGEEARNGEASPLEEAKNLLVLVKREIRNVVWSLKSDELMTLTPREMLLDIARQTGQIGRVQVRTMLRGLPRRLPGSMMCDLSMFVREAMTNAIKNGHAKTILLTSDPRPGGRFSLVIANDGAPFDPTCVPGVAEGHFGLQGMRERAYRMGMSLLFVPSGRWMTVKLEVRS